MTKIYVDHREDPKFIRELEKKDLDIEVKQLVSADIILRAKGKNGKINTIGIEKKTQNDLLNSIIDKRLIYQLISLKNNFSCPILIIEGEENIYKIRNFHPNAIRGMLSSIAIDYQIPMIHTKNHRDTAAFIKAMANRLEKPDKVLSKLRKRKPFSMKEHQEYIIETLPGVGPTLSKALLKQFGSIRSIMNSNPETIKKVEKIGPKKSKQIHEIINKKYTKSSK